MLSLQHISKYFQVGGNKNIILNNISLDIDEGEFVSVMGPSGSGKSTLLNIIGMLDEPSEGYHYFMGQAVHQHIGLVRPLRRWPGIRWLRAIFLDVQRHLPALMKSRDPPRAHGKQPHWLHQIRSRRKRAGPWSSGAKPCGPWKLKSIPRSSGSSAS